MRPRIDLARHTIMTLLRRGPHNAQQLAVALNVSRRTVLRLIEELGPSALAWGAASRRRYAWRRPLRGQDRNTPLFAVDANGRASEAGTLALAAPSGSYCDIAKLGWPVDPSSADGWWAGLPYPLYDMQPQGFLGRMFAQHEHLTLEVSADPRAWSDDDIVWVLSRRGADQSGNLILGSAALEHYQHELAHPCEPVKDSRVRLEYVRYADEAVSKGLPASSVAGESPKFTAIREQANAATPHVIVKF
jgi:HTH domain